MEHISEAVPEPFTKAHAQFLEELSNEEFWDYAFEAARPATASPTSPAPQREEFLICEIGTQYCMLPLTALLEVLPIPQHFTKLPASPQWMIGMIAWRGETLAVIDLMAYLANDIPPAGINGQLLIAHIDDLTLGLVVSAMSEITAIDSETIASPTQRLQAQSIVVKGQQEQAVILDVDDLLKDIIQRIRNTSLL